MNNRKKIYRKKIPGLGEFSLFQFDLKKEAPIVHDWVNRDYARYWGMQNTTLEKVAKDYQDIIAGHTDVIMGYLDDQPAFLLECYDPVHDLIGKHYEVKKGDCGMHMLVAPPTAPIPQFTTHVFTTIMEFLFTNPDHQRIVVEPDIRNEKIHTLNKKMGFVYQDSIELPHKTAQLAFCTRNNYLETANVIQSKKRNNPLSMNPIQTVSHLDDQYAWRHANHLFIRKAIAEFSHELLLSPILESRQGKWTQYVLPADNPDISYHFLAQRLRLDHWLIQEQSIVKTEHNKPVELNGIHFILEFKDALGIPSEMLPVYLEEITSTLCGATFMLHRTSPLSPALAHADHQTIEQAMTAGHPCFVANNGRIGFDAQDYQQYAPEAASPFEMIWLAGHKSRATYSGTEDWSYDKLLQQELDEEFRSHLDQQLVKQELDPNDYYYFPMHPWQWFNKLATIFAPDIASKKLVCLGYGEDSYAAQQSIRTTYNVSHPEKHYVKTALSILNMGFMRGLSPYYMDSTPAITEWIDRLFIEDSFFQNRGFLMLREVATLGYRNAHFESLGKTSPYNKMLAVLWRESPISMLEPNQRLMTMAALLHIDEKGNALVTELIKASGLSSRDWLKAYFRCYLQPLIHCFYRYDLVFMPHGENLILIMENHVPVKAIMKDITEEICILSEDVQLPEDVKRIQTQVPEALRPLSIFTDVFDCFFRFLSAILVEHEQCSEAVFWEEVALSVSEYQAEWPELKDKFEKYDLFIDSFTRSCLNRLQLKNNQQMVNLADPSGSLQFVGTLNNPIANYQKAIAEKDTFNEVYAK